MEKTVRGDNNESELWFNWLTRKLNSYEAFKDFVGSDYELSELEIGYIPPTQEDWEIGLYRVVTCYVYVPDSQLSGSMQGSGI